MSDQIQVDKVYKGFWEPSEGALSQAIRSLGSFKNRKVICNRVDVQVKYNILGTRRKAENKEGHKMDIY